MEVVLGVDLGTSAVKVSAVDREGKIVAQQSEAYSLNQPEPGYSEQNPEDWVTGTTAAIDRLIKVDVSNRMKLLELAILDKCMDWFY